MLKQVVKRRKMLKQVRNRRKMLKQVVNRRKMLKQVVNRPKMLKQVAQGNANGSLLAAWNAPQVLDCAVKDVCHEGCVVKQPW